MIKVCFSRMRRRYHDGGKKHFNAFPLTLATILETSVLTMTIGPENARQFISDLHRCKTFLNSVILIMLKSTAESLFILMSQW